MKPMFTMAIGIQGSGKSRFGENFDGYLSSDALREEIYGDAKIQDNPQLIFEELERRAIFRLKCGKNVYFDATNTSAKRRRAMLTRLRNQVGELTAVAIYFNTPIEICKERNSSRERKVPEYVIDRTYKSLQIPTKNEGWDYIFIQHPRIKSYTPLKLDRFKKIEDFHEFLIENDLSTLVNFEQHNPFHSLTADAHMFDAFKYVCEHTECEITRWATLLHDIGKPFCQQFEGEYARYFGHDNVSAQMAMSILSDFGMESDKVLTIAELIQNHMRIHQVVKAGEKSLNRLKNEIGETKFNMLMMLHEGDMSTH